MILRSFLFTFSVLLFTSLGMAQAPTSQSAAKGTGERKKSLSFEDELVTGNNAKPELEYILTKKNFNFKRLIRLRENFVPEMRRTAEDVRRGGN
jgi:hypothetical protein